jgi:hypothetical protein
MNAEAAEHLAPEIKTTRTNLTRAEEEAARQQAAN